MTTKTNGATAQGVVTEKGKETVPALSNVSIKENGKAEEKPEAKKEVKPQPQTVEQRKAKTELFNGLLDKHEKYLDTQHSVEKFAIGSNEHSQTLMLKDNNGNHFTTGNPVILKPVIELVRKQIAAQVGQLETEILDFIV